MANTQRYGSQRIKRCEYILANHDIENKTNRLVIPRIDSQQVVLKILKAENSDHNRELSILLTLSDSDVEHAGKRHVVELLDYFYHTGPNGNHLCLVFPLMTSDGEAMTISGNPQEAGYLRAISRQLLLGLDFLHQSGIVHCGMSRLFGCVSNILIGLKQISNRQTFCSQLLELWIWRPCYSPPSSAQLSGEKG